MPRKGRGGARQGTPGTVYTNRTDLNEPISTVPNQEYGKAKAQADAQRVVPMGASPVAAAPEQPQTPAQMPAAASRPLPRPGQMPYLDPSSTPHEPATSGLTGVTPPKISEMMDSLSRGSRNSEMFNNIISTAKLMGI
jgi:hypothetical protein